MADSNRRHPRCKRGDTTTQTITESEVTATPPDACTAACTSKAENANADTLTAGQQPEGNGTDQGDPLATIAATIADLSPADQAKLAAMLVATQDEAELAALRKCIERGTPYGNE